MDGILIMDVEFEDFVWDEAKAVENIRKHEVDFYTAAGAFKDPNRRIYGDPNHSRDEQRFYCLGCVGGKVMTVRYVHREGKIRIFGAGYWRKGRELYHEA